MSLIMNSYRIPTMDGIFTYICWIFMVNRICHTWMVWDTESPPFWPKVWHSSFQASFAVTGVSKSGLVAPTPLQQFPNDKRLELTWLHIINMDQLPQVKEQQIQSLTLVNRPKLLRCWIKTDVLSSQRYLSWPYAKAARCQGKFFQLDGTHVWYFCWLFLSLSFIFSKVHPRRIAFNTSWVIIYVTLTIIIKHTPTHLYIYIYT